MDFEEIYRLAQAAHAGEDFLSGLAEAYKMDYEDFEHSEENVGWRQDGRNVSRAMLRETTDQVVEAVPEYKEMLRSMETAREEIEDYSTSRFVDGSKRRPEDISQQLDEMIESYRNILESIWNTGYRIQENPELEADPIDMRYKRWKRQLQQEEETENWEALGDLLDQEDPPS